MLWQLLLAVFLAIIGAPGLGFLLTPGVKRINRYLVGPLLWGTTTYQIILIVHQFPGSDVIPAILIIVTIFAQRGFDAFATNFTLRKLEERIER